MPQNKFCGTGYGMNSVLQDSSKNKKQKAGEQWRKTWSLACASGTKRISKSQSY